ncbi:MAG: DUF559 domain-containing protein [Acidimicrobiales bacterium]
MRTRELEVAMRALAEQQHGLVARRQLLRLGASREAVQCRLRSPGWVALTPQVLRLAGSQGTFAQRCMAGVLDAGAGAVASHLSSAVLWGLPGFRPDEVHVNRARTATSRVSRLAVVHESRYFPPHHCTVADSVPVTTVSRTVFDLTGSVHPLRAERALDNALSRNLVDLRALRAVAIELLEHGLAGSALMRQLLDDRGAGYIPPASGLEARFFAVLVAAGIEPPDRQVDLGGAAWEGRVDYYYRRHRLVIEVDSDRHHTSKLDAEADARRDAALEAAGFQVLRITEGQLKDRPWEVVALVRAALAQAAA